MLVTTAGVLAAVAGTLLAISVNVATGGTARRLPAIEAHPWWWSIGMTLALAAAVLLGWWAQRRYEQALVSLVPAEQRPESWVVDRPVELDRIVRTLRRRRSTATVGITTAVQGAGGFGKTTLARLVRADRRVLRRFGGRVYWVTIGRDVRRGALVEKINDLVRQIDPARAQPFTDVRQAADYLAAVLSAGPRRLVVVDDVWFEDQLSAFPAAGRSVRLVTTRVPSLVAGRGIPVEVDQMSENQARAVLTADLPSLPATVVNGLLVQTGRWPLLLRLVNKILLDQTRLRPDIASTAEAVLHRLQREGALHVDHLTGTRVSQLDVSDPDQRDKAVAATIEASTGLLGTGDRDRFAELAIFVEDELVPVSLISILWQATAGVDAVAAGALCARLADLALLTLSPDRDGGIVSLHDVVRDFLHDEIGDIRAKRLHQMLLAEVASGLPGTSPAEWIEGLGELASWWEIPEKTRYLWDHLIEHLLAAEENLCAEAVATDLRWVGARLEQSGLIAPMTDLAHLSTQRAARLRRVLSQTAHLLPPTEPTDLLTHAFYSRVIHDPDWGRQVRTLAAGSTTPTLISTWPLPDLPDPALVRTLAGHLDAANAVAIAVDRTWLATSGDDGSTRIWDYATGVQRVLLKVERPTKVLTIAIAPDGSWLTTGDERGVVRIWDLKTSALRAVGRANDWPVQAVAIAPDGSWFVTGGADGATRIWGAATCAPRTVLAGGSGRVLAVAIAPDGSWLASGSGDGTARIWEVNGRLRLEVTGGRWPVQGLAAAANGQWIATAGEGNDTYIWEATTGKKLRGMGGSGSVVAVAPDDTWLAVTSGNAVNIWETTTGKPRAKLVGHAGAARGVAVSSDGTWLATVGSDGTARIWDTAIGTSHAKPTSHAGAILAMALAPDEAWLATVDAQGAVHVRDAMTGSLPRKALRSGSVQALAVTSVDSGLVTAGTDGRVFIFDIFDRESADAERTKDARTRLRKAIPGNAGWAEAVSISGDGTWLASAGADGTVRIWDPTTGERRQQLSAHTGPVKAIAITADGTWLATAGNDGTVRIWDPTTGERRQQLSAHTGPVNAIAITADGTWLATAGNDGTVRIWDPTTGERRQQLSAHTGPVNAIAITADGARLASTGDDGSVWIWDTIGGQALTTTRMERPGRACAWSQAGTSLIVGGEAGLYRFAVECSV
ncbi:NB-ARC domain-containing protein [Micromonospora profundi]|uniref:NB-ARC domain-containing protein n=1 Tax=Micromonospora profundi TaxID=1420889 RepID=A0AAJ6L3H7_9ACTN|nr:NB-ARC domain-containing protein [Micromonospora profundi]WLS43213.1 NB-ARC domain-containing protein [Micromonospora profundi]